MTKLSLVSPVRCTSMVAFGSGRGTSVSVNSDAGIRPSVLPPRSTTTPCSVYATTFTSIISFCGAASCGSLYWSMSLLISSALASSSAAAAASASTAAVCACASACAWASSGFTACTGAGVAGVSAPPCAASGAGVVSAFWGVSLSWAAAVAAEDTGLSWSENMFNRLRDFYPCFLSSQSLPNPNRGNCKEGLQRGSEEVLLLEVTRSLPTEMPHTLASRQQVAGSATALKAYAPRKPRVNQVDLVIAARLLYLSLRSSW